MYFLTGLEAEERRDSTISPKVVSREKSSFRRPLQFPSTTVNDRYSGDRFSGNDGFSGTKPPDDAILFTVSGITVLVELFLEHLGF